MDYDLQSQLLINALKEAEGQRAVRMPEAKMQGNYAILPGAGNMLDAGFNRALGNYQKPQIEQQMADLRGQQAGDYDRLLKELTTPGMKQVQDNSSAMGPLPEPVARNVPLSPMEESQRRLGVYGQMSRLPMAKAMAEAGIKSEVDFPEKQALREQTIAATNEQLRQRAEDQFLAKRASEDFQASQNAIFKRTADQQNAHLAAMIAAKGSGGGPRDRFSVQTGPDNQLYRVNLETGQADPVSIRSALPNAVSAQQPGVGLQKPKAPPTEAERTSAGYLGRMEAAEKALGSIQGGEATELTAAAGALPLVGPYAQRKAETLQQSKYRQYTDDWIRAKLRKESGAVIGKDEMAQEYTTYFPQPGDRPEVIEQKAQARLQAQEQLRTSAGQVKPTQARPRGATYDDPAKEARYQKFLRSQGK